MNHHQSWKKTARMLWVMLIGLGLLAAWIVPGLTQPDAVQAQAGVITITESGGSTEVTEGGATDTFDVSLSPAPVGDVDVWLSWEHPQCSVQGGTSILTFPDGDGSAQTVTIEAFDDLLVEGAHTCNIDYGVQNSSDPDYPPAYWGTVTVNITDNDTDGVYLDLSATGDISEDGSTSTTFDIALSQTPSVGLVEIDASVDSLVCAITSPSLPVQFPLGDAGPKTITVEALDNVYAEDSPHPCWVDLNVVTSSEGWLPADWVSSVPINVYDNDPADIVFTGQAVVTEGSPATDSYQVGLTGLPTDPVEITLYPDQPDCEVVSANPITFPAGDNGPITVDVRAIDDSYEEGQHYCWMNHEITNSSAERYTPGWNVQHPVIVQDDDSFNLHFTPQLVNTVEGAANPTYDITLDPGHPGLSVSIDVDGPCWIVDSLPLNFAFSDDGPRTVEVGVPDDSLVTGTQHCYLHHSVELGVPGNPWFNSGELLVNIAEDDTVGVAIGGAGDLDESGGTSNIWVGLSTSPTSPVEVTITPDSNCQVNSGSPVNFGVGDQGSYQVEVQAVDDLFVEGGHYCDFTVEITSGYAPDYAPGVVGTTSSWIQDNDWPGAGLVITGPDLDESDTGIYGTLDFWLMSDVQGDVVVDLSTDGSCNVISTNPVTFSTGSVGPVVVTLEVVDDDWEEGTPHYCNFQAQVSSSADYGYSPGDSWGTSYPVIDNDAPNVVFTPTDVPANEGDTVQYTVQLPDLTSGEVHVDVSHIDPQCAILTPMPLVFTSTTAQTVDVLAIDDLVDHGGGYHCWINHEVTYSDDPAYYPTSVGTVRISVTDNDTAGVWFDPWDFGLNEGGGSQWYDVGLTQNPTSDVTLQVTFPDGQCQIVGSDTITFPAGDSGPYGFEVEAVDDTFAEWNHNCTLEHNITASSDPVFPVGYVAALVPNINDNDWPGMNFTQTGPMLDESNPGVAGAYEVTLQTDLQGDVEVSLWADDSCYITSANPITFTPSSLTQTVTVEVNDDDWQEGTPHYCSLQHSITNSADPGYGPGNEWWFNYPVADNDAPPVLLDPANLTVSEDGLTDTFDITLTGPAPTDDVWFEVYGDPDCFPSAPPLPAAIAAGTTGPLTITVTATDDLFGEGPHQCWLYVDIVGGTDPTYSHGTVGIVIGDVIDNDESTPNININPEYFNLNEGGGSFWYNLDLSHNPSTSMVIHVESTDGQCTLPATDLPIFPWENSISVEVYATDDNFAEWNHSCTIVHYVPPGGGSPEYPDGTWIGQIFPNINDNDWPEMSFNMTGPELDESSPATVGTYELWLETDVQGEVHFDIYPDWGGCNVTSALPIVFDTGSVGPVTVTLEVIDDGDAEGTPHYCSLDHQVVYSEDPGYYPGWDRWYDYPVIDNDAPSIILNPTTVPANEGDTVSYTVQAPDITTGEVHVEVSYISSECELLTPMPLVLTNTTPQTIQVEVKDDQVDRGGNYTCWIHHNIISSTDPAYWPSGAGTVIVDAVDNDDGGVWFDPWNFDLWEDGGTNWYEVGLDTEPVGDVTLQVTFPDGQCQIVGSDTITFPAGNGSSQWFEVQAVDDNFAENNHNCILHHEIIASGDGLYSVGFVADLTPRIYENDWWGMDFTITGPDLDEGNTGTLGTYEVTLQTDLQGAVVVDIQPDSNCNVVSADPITFTPGNLTQTVTLSVIDDGNHEGTPHYCGINHQIISSADPGHNPGDGRWNPYPVIDNDSPPVTLNPAYLTANEGDTVYYDVSVLPLTGTVQIDVTPGAECEIVSPLPLPLVFSPGNETITVGVLALDDFLANGTHTCWINHQIISSTDPQYYNAGAGVVLVDIFDNDTVGVWFDTGGFNLWEDGGTYTYSVGLNTEPSGSVTIEVTSPDGQCNILSGSPIVFGPGDTGSYPVEVEAVDDNIVEWGHNCLIAHNITASTAPEYPAPTFVGNLSPWIQDNDYPDMTFTQTGPDLDEGTPAVTGEYEVTLATDLLGDVIFQLFPDDSCTVSPTTVTFGVGYSGPETITVTVIDDPWPQGSPHYCGIRHEVISSAEPGYNPGWQRWFDYPIMDDDAPPIDLSPTYLTTTEGDPPVQYTVSLPGPLTGVVEITVNNDSSDCDVLTPMPLVFDPGTLSHIVDVQAIDDLLLDGFQECWLWHQVTYSTDPLYYPNAGGGAVRVGVDDNDVNGFWMNNQYFDLGEGGGGSNYWLGVDSPPPGPIVILVTSPDGNCEVINSATGEFTITGSGDPVEIAIRAVDDNYSEGQHSCLVQHTVVSSADPSFNPGDLIGNVTHTVYDNDSTGLHADPDNPVVYEEGTTSATTDVSLTSDPMSAIAFWLSTDGQCIVTPMSLIYPQDDPSAQTITVTAVDDTLPEGSPHYCEVQFQVTSSSSDDYYVGWTGQVYPRVMDNDGPPITLVPDRLYHTEGDPPVTYDITLGSVPTGDVTIELYPGAECEIVGPSNPIVFSGTAGPITVQAQAVDDLFSEGTEWCAIDHQIIASGDPAYPPGDVGLVVMEITDNDVTGVGTWLRDWWLSEGNNGRLEAWLRTQPTGDVTLTLTPDAQCALTSSATATIPAGSWNSVFFNYDAVDDLVAEGDHQCALSLDITASAAAEYPVGPVGVIYQNVADNDTAGVTITGAGPLQEGGPTTQVTYDVSLDSIPSGAVTIQAQPDLSQCQMVGADSVVFPAGDPGPYQLTVEVIDDTAPEGPHTCGIQHEITASAAPEYPLGNTYGWSLDIVDNDAPPVAFTPTYVEIHEAGPATATYDILLGLVPSGDVHIQISTGPDCTISSANPVVFSSTNGPQTVTVQVVDDLLVEPHWEACLLQHEIVYSDDPAFPLVQVGTVTANVEDNDMSGLVINPYGIDVTENGGPASYQISLSTIPADPVELTMTPTGDCVVTSMNPVIISDLFPGPYTVTVEAVDDTDDNGTRLCTIDHSVTNAGAPQYPPGPLGDQDVNVHDDDPAVITLDKSVVPDTLPEPGGSVTYTYLLTNTSTVNDVTIDTLTDDVLLDLNGQGDCAVPQTIGPGGSYSCSVTTSVSGNAGDTFGNIGTASGTDAEGDAVSDTDDALVTLTDVATVINVTKSPAPGNVTEPGGSVVFTISVENTSASDSVTINSLIDSDFADVTVVAGDVTATTCAVPWSIGVGATDTCTFTANVTGDFGVNHENTLTASGIDSDSAAVAGQGMATVVIDNQPSSITVTKTPDVLSVTEPGEDVTFTVDITNNSTADTVTINTLTDSVYGDVTLIAGTTCVLPQDIAPGGVYSCAFTGYVPGLFGIDPPHTDMVTATGVDDDSEAVSDTSPLVSISYDDLVSSIDVQKDAVPATVLIPGEDVTYTFTVENTGDGDVTLDSLVDTTYGDLNGQGDCSVPQTILEGGSYSCSITVYVGGVVGDIHTNIVTATATNAVSDPLTDADDATVTVTDLLSAIDAAKTPDLFTVPETGANVTFTARVENTGMGTVTLDSLIDSVYGDVTLIAGTTCAVPQTIPELGFYACTFTAFVSGDYGVNHQNTLTASATDAAARTITDDVTATVTFTDVPSSITVDKTAVPDSMPENGGPVTYTVTVNNTSTADTVSIATMNDDVYGDVTNAANPLLVSTTCDSAVGFPIPPGNSLGCNFVANVTGNAGYSLTDTVTVTVNDDDAGTASNSGSATVTLTDVAPATVFDKVVAPNTVPETGGAVTYTFTVTNNSTVDTVTITSLTDDQLGNLDGQGTCVVTPPVAIPPGGNYSCQVPHTFGAADAGDTVTNTATAAGSDDDSAPINLTAQATVTFTDVAGGGITVTKTPNPASLPEPGGDVTYTVLVTNTSTIDAVTLDTLADNVFGDLNGQGDCAVPQTIAAGGSYTCSFTQAVTGAPGLFHTNTVTAVGVDDDGTPVANTGSATVTFTDVVSGITVTKTANPTELPEPGGDVTFTVLVTNTSATDTVYITALGDSAFGDLNGQGDCAVPQTIPVGGSYTCSFTRTVIGDPLTPHTNTVAAGGADDDGAPVINTGSATVNFTDVAAAISVTKDANPTSIIHTGDTVTYTVTVNNDSTLDAVTITSLNDSVFGDLNGQGTCAVPQTLPVGGSYNCTFDQTVSGAAGADHVNTVTASGTDDDGFPVSADDDATVNLVAGPSIQVDPTLVHVDEGGTNTFDMWLSITPSGGQVDLQLAFDPAEIMLNGSAVSPIAVSLTDTVHVAVTVEALDNTAEDGNRTTTVTPTIVSSTAPEYPDTMAVPTVDVRIHDDETPEATAQGEDEPVYIPPPPPAPPAYEYNFDGESCIRTDVPISLRDDVYVRELVVDGDYLWWYGSPQTNPGSVGNMQVLNMGVLEAVDVFSPTGNNDYSEGVMVCFCRPGNIWLLADEGNQQRAPFQRPTYTVPEYPGFTCATIYRPGTLVLVEGGDPAPPPELPVPPGCAVTTDYIVNLRSEPRVATETFVQMVPYQSTLTAISTIPGWYRVEYAGVPNAWVSAQYVTPNEACSP